MRVAGDADVEVVGRTLAAGFADDPVITWVFSEPEREVKLDRFFGFLAREALVPLGASFVLPGAVANWTPPETPPWPDERSVRFGELLSQVCTDRDLERLGVLDAATQAHHPEERHWFLGSIATLPSLRGRGLGSALLTETLAVVDRDALPAYLESTNPRNVALYERYGFRVTARLELPDGPVLTTMWRDATG